MALVGSTVQDRRACGHEGELGIWPANGFQRGHPTICLAGKKNTLDLVGRPLF